MASGWFEQRTRIPFAGILAMVLIVAVVAFFLRSGLDAVLGPESTVSVRTAEEGAPVANLKGSASFQGERHVQLLLDERMQGVLSTQKGTLVFSVDAMGRVLELRGAQLHEEIILSSTSDGLALEASFEYDGAPAYIIVRPDEHRLVWQPSGTLPIDVALTDVAAYRGFFLYHGEQHKIIFSPAGPHARIVVDNRESSVPLVFSHSEYVGTWHDQSGSSHPIAIQMDKLLAIVGELW